MNLSTKRFGVTLNELPQMISYLEEALSLSMQQRVGVEEVLVNIIEHGYRKKTGKITICYRKEGRFFIIRIIDQGKAFNPLIDSSVQKSHSLETSSLRGRGILLAKAIFPSMAYERVNGNNILELHCS